MNRFKSFAEKVDSIQVITSFLNMIRVTKNRDLCHTITARLKIWLFALNIYVMPTHYNISTKALLEVGGRATYWFVCVVVVIVGP